MTDAKGFVLSIGRSKGGRDDGRYLGDVVEDPGALPRAADRAGRGPPRLADGDGDASRLVSSLALTRAEAEVALGIGEGLAPSEIAASRGVSIHTVRNQLKHAMAKLGLRRQVELAVLVERTRAGR